MSEELHNFTNEWGHILLYAPTNGGKTTLCQYLLNLLQFEDIYIFTTSQDYDDFRPRCKNIYVFKTEDEFKQQAQEIFDNDQYIKDVSRNCVVFDDFNEIINPKDPLYKDMFQRGRHKGVRIINICHHSKAVCPTVRSQTRYLFLASSIQREEIKKLNELFIHMSLQELVGKLLDLCEDTRNYLLFDVPRKRFQEVYSDVFKKQQQIQLRDNGQLRGTNNEEQKHTIQNDIELHQDNNGQGYMPSHFSAVNPIQLLNKQAMRDFTDNSKNVINIENNIKIQQQIEQQQVNQLLQINQVKFKTKLELTELKYKVREMIYKTPKSLGDIQFLVQGLTRLLRPEEIITQKNWQEFAEVFLENYFHENYVYQKEEPIKKNMSVQQLLPDVARVGQQLYVTNQTNIIETVSGLSGMFNKYFN